MEIVMLVKHGMMTVGWWRNFRTSSWSIQRTPEQIASSMYDVDPSTEGLVAYWKFNEGTGKQVKDYTANGNNITAENDLTWTKVSLPEK